ncbi:DNA binding domain, excisionase family [Bacteroidales bacterium Barb6]|nr:DNA binding domain, excisionase family [Bacteroidales bacterium Barb6]
MLCYLFILRRNRLFGLTWTIVDYGRLKNGETTEKRMKGKHPIRKVCEYCGNEFEAFKSTVRYCSLSCNRKAYKEIKRQEVIALTESLTGKETKEETVKNLSGQEYLSVSEADQILGWCKQSVYNYCHKGIIPAIRISRRTTLIRRMDIDTLFNEIESYQVLPANNRKPADDWYTLADITERYGILRHQIRKIVNAENIPTKKDGTHTLVAKNKTDAYFRKKGFDDTAVNLAGWCTSSEIMEWYGMSEQAVYVFVSKYAIPKKRVNGKLFYSKQHIDKLKGNRK